MNVLEIPRVLFNEFSEKLGKGKEKTVSVNGSVCLLKELNPKTAKSEGAIGLQEFSTEYGLQLTFVLWDKDPREKDTIFERKPIFKIIAGPINTKIWCGGSGYKIIERCAFYSDGIDLSNPILQVIPLILQRASELSEPQCEEFWEVERNPKGIYSKP